MSLEQLAVSLQKSWATVDAYERGRVTPPTEGLPALADLLGVTIDDLFEVAP